MAIDLADLVSRDLDAAAERFRGSEFATERGADVVVRVRTRRALRAAGAGAVAVVAAVGLAAAAWAAPWRAADADVSPAGSATSTQSPLPTLEIPDAPTPLPQADIVGDSPFECGYAFPSDALTTRHVDTVSVWFTSRETAEKLALADLTDPPDSLPGDRTTGVVTAEFYLHSGTSRVAWAAQDPGTRTVAAFGGSEREGTFEGTSVGFGFVAVRDGVVVGADRSVDAEDPNYASSLLRPSSNNYRLYLFDSAGAISSCGGEPLDWSSVDLYAVAGSATFGEGQVLESVEYAWRKVDLAVQD